MRDYEAATAFLGEWGPFQLQVFFLLSLFAINHAFLGLQVVFVGDIPPHRCLVPVHANLSAAWRNVSIPLEVDSHSGALVPSKCSRYKLHALQSFSVKDLVPGVDVNLSNVQREGCLDGWEYDNSTYTSTIATEWDLVCDDSWKVPLTSSVFFCGVLLGSFITGQLSDRFGRKVVLFVSTGVQLTFAFIQVFSPSWAVFCALHFAVGGGHVSKYMAAFVLGTEILTPPLRTGFSTLGMNLSFVLGYMLLPLVAFFIRDWRMLQLGLALPGLLYVPLWWCIPESPRWLLSQGRVKEAEAILRRAAQKNKVKDPEVIFNPAQSTLQSKKEAHNICDLLRYRNIRWMSVILCLAWIAVNIGYLALSLNTSNLHGNGYLNCFLSAVVEVPAYIFSWIIFRWWSRRLPMFTTLFLGGVVLLFIQLTPANLNGLAIALEMMGKFALTIAYAIVYAYTVELYPTVLRNTALGVCSMVGRLGAITAPYFIYLRSYSASLPYIVMGSVLLVTGLLCLLLPESHGMPLPDTIAQMHPFPGCCQKRRYIPTETTGDEKTAESKFSQVVPQIKEQD
ncbi:organic cation/carnitine transporter 2-like [Genypterus blacodes]|uniref:organic cation/carnitine transporter 2-like n=1 Tax=Genypterus blacodes TaxID=154954 RepID=UPI003F75CACD